MNWYKFNIAEFRAQTVDIGDAEELAYRRLIDHYYTQEGPLKYDMSALMDVTNMDEEIVALVLDSFFELKGKHWHKADIDADIARRKNQLAVNRAQGKKGGRPPKPADVR